MCGGRDRARAEAPVPGALTSLMEFETSSSSRRWRSRASPGEQGEATHPSKVELFRFRGRVAAEKAMEDVRTAFCEFLAELAEGRPTDGAWERHAVAHSMDEELEGARRELGAASLKSLPDSLQLRTKAQELRDRLLPATERSASELSRGTADDS